MKLSGLKLTAEQIIAAGGIRSVLESKAKPKKSATVAHMPSVESLQRELAESEAAIGQPKRAYYDSLKPAQTGAPGYRPASAGRRLVSGLTGGVARSAGSRALRAFEPLARYTSYVDSGTKKGRAVGRLRPSEWRYGPLWTSIPPDRRGPVPYSRSCRRRGRGRGGDDKPKEYKMPEIVIVQEPHSVRRTRGM